MNRLAIVVSGSRSWTDEAAVFRTLDSKVRGLPPDWQIRLYHGGAKGADQIAARWASGCGVKAIEVLPDWSAGKFGGKLRNAAMIDRAITESEGGAVMLCAFWKGHSAGTAHAVAWATWRNVPISLLFVP